MESLQIPYPANRRLELEDLFSILTKDTVEHCLIHRFSMGNVGFICSRKCWKFVGRNKSVVLIGMYFMLFDVKLNLIINIVVLDAHV